MAYALPLEKEDRLIGKILRSTESEAFDLLYRRYAGALKEFCRRRLGDPAEAEDACHEALIKAHRALPRFRKGARVWPWLATIADHVCTDFRRSSSRKASLGEDVASDFSDPEEEAARGMREEILTEALQALPSRYRDYIRLRDLEGWSYEEISVFFRATIPSVKSTLLRARRTLRQEIEEVARRRKSWPLPVAVPNANNPIRRLIRSARAWLREMLVNSRTPIEKLEGLTAVLANAALALAMSVAMGIPADSLPSNAKGFQNAGIPATTTDVESSWAPQATLGRPSTPEAQHEALHHETPKVAVTADVDSNGQEERVVIPGVTIDCGAPEKRGPVLSTVCSNLGQ
jgi:RNA polymerase sigma-70 factor (ECF subfamily)